MLDVWIDRRLHFVSRTAAILIVYFVPFVENCTLFELSIRAALLAFSTISIFVRYLWLGEWNSSLRATSWIGHMNEGHALFSDQIFDSLVVTVSSSYHHRLRKRTIRLRPVCIHNHFTWYRIIFYRWDELRFVQLDILASRHVETRNIGENFLRLSVPPCRLSEFPWALPSMRLCSRLSMMARSRRIQTVVIVTRLHHKPRNTFLFSKLLPVT